jgi:K+-transporting ATPase KdpF subunit
MLDLFYVVIGCGFVLLCWLFTKACDKLSGFRLYQGSPRFSISEGKESMDYIIAGVASLGLFIYLIYALLRPEKF